MASIDDTVRASGRSIASAQTGRADGAPLFYLHGLQGRAWTSTIPSTRRRWTG